MTADPRRIAPTAVAAALAIVYVIVSPPSLDLAAHLFRAELFRQEGFGLWNNWWYAGHNVVGYSVLFPAVSAALSPQLAGAIAATLTATGFELLAYRHFGPNAWLGALVFGAATAVNLYTGRLAFAFGALPAMAAVLALDRERTALASGLGFLTAISSPVAALFAALAGVAHAIGRYMERRELRRMLPGVSLAIAALLPVGLLAVAFPEGGSEPFAYSTLWPIPLLAIGLLLAARHRSRSLQVGIVLYTLGTIVAYFLTTPVGSNAARLGTFMAAPLAALLLWPRRAIVLALVAAPLLYVEFHDPVRDLSAASRYLSAATAYYQPLLRFLERQSGPPFRVEIPFTGFHWEAYVVARRFPIPRGWERQLDIEYNTLFYNGTLSPATYEAWLHQNAVRFVAVPDTPLDYGGASEGALIARGQPYLRLVMRTVHWRMYSVADPSPIVQGAATLRAIGPNSLTMQATRAGSAYIRVHFSPYWALGEGTGCVSPAGDFTRLQVSRPGPVKLVISFSLGRIGARTPRCR
jgi:hypothetical protein